MQTTQIKPTYIVNFIEQRQHAGLAESGTQSALSVIFSWGSFLSLASSIILSQVCVSTNGAGAKSNSCREEDLGATAGSDKPAPPPPKKKTTVFGKLFGGGPKASGEGEDLGDTGDKKGKNKKGAMKKRAKK